MWTLFLAIENFIATVILYECTGYCTGIHIVGFILKPDGRYCFTITTYPGTKRRDNIYVSLSVMDYPGMPHGSCSSYPASVLPSFAIIFLSNFVDKFREEKLQPYLRWHLLHMYSYYLMTAMHPVHVYYIEKGTKIKLRTRH